MAKFSPLFAVTHLPAVSTSLCGECSMFLSGYVTIAVHGTTPTVDLGFTGHKAV